MSLKNNFCDLTSLCLAKRQTWMCLFIKIKSWTLFWHGTDVVRRKLILFRESLSCFAQVTQQSLSNFSFANFLDRDSISIFHLKIVIFLPVFLNLFWSNLEIRKWSVYCKNEGNCIFYTRGGQLVLSAGHIASLLVARGPDFSQKRQISSQKLPFAIARMRPTDRILPPAVLYILSRIFKNLAVEKHCSQHYVKTRLVFECIADKILMGCP
jgi:hypothetical protein